MRNKIMKIWRILYISITYSLYIHIYPFHDWPFQIGMTLVEIQRNQKSEIYWRCNSCNLEKQRYVFDSLIRTRKHDSIVLMIIFFSYYGNERFCWSFFLISLLSSFLALHPIPVLFFPSFMRIPTVHLDWYSVHQHLIRSERRKWRKILSLSLFLYILIHPFFLSFSHSLATAALMIPVL